MHLLGDDRGFPGDRFQSLVEMDGEVGSLNRGKGKRGIESRRMGNGRQAKQQEDGKNLGFHLFPLRRLYGRILSNLPAYYLIIYICSSLLLIFRGQQKSSYPACVVAEEPRIR